MASKFTILIPTRNRCATLRYTIATCLAQQDDNLKVIVSDNVSSDKTRDVVESFSDRRLQYVCTGKPLSMSGNFEFSLSKVSEGFVMHLGDDDGLVPDTLKRVRQTLARERTKAVTSSQAIYYWPSTMDTKSANTLVCSIKSGIERRSAKKFLKKVLNYQLPYSVLPSTYNGFVHHDVIAAATSNGRYFNSSIPDCYSGIVNCGILDSYAYENAPFLISGLSGKSNGSQVFSPSNADGATLYERPDDLILHPALVYCPALEIIVAQAFYHARDHVPALKSFDMPIERICAAALRDSPKWMYGLVTKAVADLRAKHGLEISVSNRGANNLSKPAILEAQSAFRRLLRGVRRMAEGYRVVDCRDFGVDNVQDAARLAHFLASYAAHNYQGTAARARRWVSRL